MKQSALTTEMKKVTAQILALNSKKNGAITEVEAEQIKAEIKALKSLLADFLKEHLRG